MGALCPVGAGPPPGSMVGHSWGCLGQRPPPNSDGCFSQPRAKEILGSRDGKAAPWPGRLHSGPWPGTALSPRRDRRFWAPAICRLPRMEVSLQARRGNGGPGRPGTGSGKAGRGRERPEGPGVGQAVCWTPPSEKWATGLPPHRECTRGLRGRPSGLVSPSGAWRDWRPSETAPARSEAVMEKASVLSLRGRDGAGLRKQSDVKGGPDWEAHSGLVFFPH